MLNTNKQAKANGIVKKHKSKINISGNKIIPASPTRKLSDTIDAVIKIINNKIDIKIKLFFIKIIILDCFYMCQQN